MAGARNLVFAQYYTACLSQASYLVGDRSSGVAAVIDPRRDIGTYLADAEAHGLRIEWVLETHVHADFLSGHLELAEATGAVIGYGSAAEVDFPVHRLVDRRRISLGDVDLEVLHTPGHTPESICLVVREHADDEVPYGVLTGDTLFLGDVGRPDLLSANGWTARELAISLYRSTRRLLSLPDETRVFPGHGAGSACGKNLSTATTGTLGEQRRTNYALAPMTEREFVRAVCAGQPTAPNYFAYAANRNRAARPIFDEHDPVPEVSIAHGLVLLDTRDPSAFARGHLPNSINVSLAGRYAEIAGTVLSADDDIVLVCEPEQAVESRNRLARIGFDRVTGFTRPVSVVAATRLTPEELSLVAAERQLIDVRGPGEVEAAGTIEGALLIPLPELLSRLCELSADRPTVVFCAGGYRSSVAASTLRAHGFSDVADLIGGFTAWVEAGLPVRQASHT
ncbi:MBL fold metallo-hydrolase [Actinokineospora globicatena]|uniref:MBL fold metallo-hydrolase n=1 Tax=Actinokineospora globicatena TaxID=103729 RepID=UPI0020A473F7|nr:rhodanese-like domain-containing protein [Actinokineospora globicatena]MCP2302816.1 Glyoxylase, beta-lactamase superfamily II [Actinokineospora globicatena]GLW78802.1 MBL fold hydrolase [Actinokineospora globicatena]GLW84531.1 MBL fold hydrolase [Actinokineospora globicatena]